MKVDPAVVKQRMERFEQVCRGEGVKLTHQRLEIFREVAKSAEHPDAETVFRGVRRRLPTVSLDTVYRTLWLLHDLELITKLGPSRERTRFDANREPHHHFVCTRCGLTRDFTSPALDEVKLPRSLRQLGTVEATHVEARGICAGCAKKKRAPQS